MIPTFDIFKRLPDGCFFWVAGDQDFESAKNRLDRLATTVPGHYLLHSQDKGFVLELNSAPELDRQVA
jgi:hypothetical protein